MFFLWRIVGRIYLKVKDICPTMSNHRQKGKISMVGVLCEFSRIVFKNIYRTV